MSYILDRTNNSSTKITVDDGTIDNTSTSLTLPGRAYSGWGEAFNENFLALLENFSNTTAPRSPITGQLWYDSANAILKCYNGSIYVSLVNGVADSNIALGTNAGQTSQGANAVAIGALAGQTSQAANTIILNATGSAVNGVSGQTSRFYVKPVRDGGSASGMLAAGFKPCYYNPTTGEFVYASS